MSSNEVAEGFTRKTIDIPEPLHIAFLMIAGKKDQDFSKRVRTLIRDDIAANEHLLTDTMKEKIKEFNNQ